MTWKQEAETAVETVKGLLEQSPIDLIQVDQAALALKELAETSPDAFKAHPPHQSIQEVDLRLANAKDEIWSAVLAIAKRDTNVAYDRLKLAQEWLNVSV
ncbi:MAG: hypothetical protein ABI811_17060 [Acidobacteriota bacterium]